MDCGWSDWDWISYGTIGAGGSLTFVRGASPEAIIRAYGFDPSAARLLSGADADRALGIGRGNEEAGTHDPWMRAGRTGEWAFGIDDGSLVLTDDAIGVVQELSRGTEAVLFTWTPVVDYMSYCVNGLEATAFESQAAMHRRGTDPDVYRREIHLPGIEMISSENFRTCRIQLLELLTTAVGIELPREVIRGMLLTVTRDGVVPMRAVTRMGFARGGQRYLYN